jgi:hypothetical protein
MEQYLRDWIQKESTILDRISQMTAVEYVERSGIPCTPGSESARQLGGIQVYVSTLLLSLKQAGLYVPDDWQHEAEQCEADARDEAATLADVRYGGAM